MWKIVYRTYYLHQSGCSLRQFLRFAHTSDNLTNKKENLSKKDDLKIDLNELNKKLEESLQESKAGKITEVDKTFMNFSTQRNVIYF